MTNGASLSLAASLRGISTENQVVQEKRNAVLAARGLLEMLVLKGTAASGLLAHGVYQASLVTAIPGKDKLGPIAVEQLGQVLDALDFAVPALASAMNQCACMDVGFNASPPSVVLIVQELDECTSRLTKVDALVRGWKTALAEFAKPRKPTFCAPPPAVPSHEAL